MSNRYPFLIQNTIFGVFVGASCMLASYLFFRSGQSVCINPQLQNVMLLLLISGGFIGTRKYREEQAEGLLSYSQALGCCFYILSIASVLYAIYTFLLYKTHPELQKSHLQMILSLLEEVYRGVPQLETIKAIAESLITAGFIALSEFFKKILTSFMFSLLLAFLLRRKTRSNNFV